VDVNHYGVPDLVFQVDFPSRWYPAGLLGGYVGEGAGNDFRGRGGLTLAPQLGRNPESGEPHVAGVVDEHLMSLCMRF